MPRNLTDGAASLRPSRALTIVGYFRSIVVAAAAAALLGGCASIDFDAPKTASYALADTDDTSLGRFAETVIADAKATPGEAGFLPVGDGIDALALRLLMAEKAEKAIDAQYYLITNDLVGFAFIDALLRAADRGVRVRLLLDDIQTDGYDSGLAALDSHPHFEIRIYNPFARRKARFMDGITSFSRVNRRMHNKSFTADYQVTLIGGRNIADEYFGASDSAKFGDLDVMGVGPVVSDVSSMFDTYWNSVYAVPVSTFVKTPKDPDAALAAFRQRVSDEGDKAEQSEYGAAFDRRLSEYVQPDENPFYFAPYELVYDSPDKTQKKLAATAASITTPLFESILNAEDEVFIVSPYFVPRKDGIEALGAISNRGVQVKVVTNSLAANNHASVHGGYSPARKPLLKEGIELYEVRPDASISGAQTEDARATLHTKSFMVDRRKLFIGSFNFDPRSAYINTELGVIIDSPDLSLKVAEKWNEALPVNTYSVFLNDKGQLRWKTLVDGQEVVYDKEPGTSWWLRFVASFMSIMPIKSQL